MTRNFIPHSPAATVSSQANSNLIRAVSATLPVVWSNPTKGAVRDVLPSLSLTLEDVQDAAARWQRFAPLVAHLFPETAPNHGRIDSPLLALDDALKPAFATEHVKRVLVKADHALPVTGCIKARGGIYEVLLHAERLAQRDGLLDQGQAYTQLASAAARALFGKHSILVGSTGNLGFSVGVIARALGFNVEVHMSKDAKAWKRDRLRQSGAHVVEHDADYSGAVAAARQIATARQNAHFIDDEDSVELFLGYSIAALDLQRQLAEQGIVVDAEHPLVVYLPCGVGGAPGGITFGLKHLYGDAAICVFVQPVGAPSMLSQLLNGTRSSCSIEELGLMVDTEADGMAVGCASLFVARTMQRLVDAIVTVTDDDLFEWSYRLWKTMRLRLEPSAAAGFAALGPAVSMLGSRLHTATHVIWTTGGSLLPEAVFAAVLSRGEKLIQNE